ncbi:MAG: hypothetical protein L0Y75_08450 [Acidobacteria bacterium]|nr:hypothetical protein [Acidobacteriota bacterium]
MQHAVFVEVGFQLRHRPCALIIGQTRCAREIEHQLDRRLVLVDVLSTRARRAREAIRQFSLWNVHAGVDHQHCVEF